MSAVWSKNQATAAKRRCYVEIQKADGTLAPRGTDFIAAGMVFIVGVNAPVADLAVGTMTNVRRALVVADFTFTAAADDVCTATAHGLQTGDGPVRLTTSAADLPLNLAIATDYWIIKIDADTFYLATSLANAYAGTQVDIGDAGTGTHTVSDTASTQRGIDGAFVYQATQAETNHDNPETNIVVDGTDYERSDGWGAHCTVDMISSASDLTSSLIEGSLTLADVLRILLRGEIAPYSIAAGVYTVRDVADTKDSHHGTITGSGRSSTGIDDAS